MKLSRISYIESKGLAEEWKTVDCTFDDVNLIVGKNASGKSRTLNVLKGLSDLLSLSNELQYSSGSYEVEFKEKTSTFCYYLEYENNEVTSEKLSIDGKIVLDRTSDGKGKIRLEETGDPLAFQTGVKHVAAVSKRDPIQHPFLEKLNQWGNGLFKYDFGTHLGKDMIGLATSGSNVVSGEPNLKNTQNAVAIFVKGKKKYGKSFIDTIISDMKDIGYDLTEIDTSTLTGFNLPPNIQGRPFGLYIQETDLACRTFQNSISSGMFRALSVIIQINYSLLSGEPSCILIDDIGEGLDFSRASDLLHLIVNKIYDSNTQLIMATNDRFIMNSVPIKNWIILERLAGNVIQHNYRNSRKLFDEFEMTGLNNFDFFSSNYLLKKSTNGN